MTENRPVEVRRPMPGAMMPNFAYPPPGAGFPPGFGPDASLPAANPIRQYLGILRRYWWLIVLSALVGISYQWYRTRHDLPLFRTSSAVQLTDQRPQVAGDLVPDYASAYGGYTDPVLTQVQVIQSRAIAELVVDSLGLQLQSITPGFYLANFEDVRVAPNAVPATLRLHFTSKSVTVSGPRDTVTAAYGTPIEIASATFTIPGPQPGWQDASLAVLPREAAIDAVLGGISAKPRDMTSVIDISFTGNDPYVVQRVASAAALQYQAFNARTARQQSHRRRIFIETQLAATDSMLQLAEARVAAYRRGTLAFSAKDRYATEQQDLATLDQRVQQLDDARRSYQGLLSALERHANGDPAALRTLAFTPDPSGNAAVGALYTDLMRYEHARDSLTTGMFARTPQHPDVQRVDALIASTEPKLIAAVRNQLAVIDGNLSAVNARRQQAAGQIASLPSSEETEQRLLRDVDNIRKMSDKLNDELQVARIAEAVEAGQVQVVDLARYPMGAITAGRRRKLAYALLIGLLFGIGLAIVTDRLNSTIRRWDDLDSVMHVPGLALVPQISADAHATLRARARATASRLLPSMIPSTRVLASEGDGQELVMISDVRSASAEAYRKLMTNLMYSASRPGLKVMVVTSASAGEGKTTTSANLAVAFAQQGRRVVLIDADLRRARVHDVFGLALEPGLTDVLVGKNTLDQGLRASGVAGLSVLPGGTLPPNPLEFLGGERMHELLDTLRAKFDVILVDTPPVLVTADAALMSVQADGVLVVVRAGRTEREAARHAVEQIRNVGGRILGAVLNDPDARTPRYGRYGDYYYGYGYAPQEGG